ncbi:MAG TPA: penicillin-binding transpeptidase domain-containing protein [Actinomycetota bacterium]|nr:penicillin-binding transpeptidase domain-containing protein [Actinomycetota bacterium]
MQPQIRKVGFALLGAFLLVFGMLNYVQIFAAESIASNGFNKRRILREYSIRRGDILTLDGVTIAQSAETGGQYKYERRYPGGSLYGHLTGFYSILYGKTRIESSYDDDLLGDTGVLTMQDIEDNLFDSQEHGHDVRLTINSELQELAREQLGDNRGAVVAMDPASGEVRALWSNPSFDPGPLASFDDRTQKEGKRAFDDSIPIATQKGYPPGSTLKVITAAAALESGEYEPNARFPDPVELDLPLTDQTLTNFTKTSCAGGGTIDLFTALEVSCDTTFAILGLRLHDELRAMSERMGFNGAIPFDVATEASSFPEVDDDNAPFRAYAGIGQGDVVATPLQMALVAATVANDGAAPRPRLVREVIDRSGAIVERFAPETLDEAMSSETADEVTEMMVAVVESGTGTNARIEGVDVAGKTGTAQSAEGAAPHAWFIAFAPANDPKIAVSVIVENGGSAGAEATGGLVAAPIARAVIEEHRRIEGW